MSCCGKKRASVALPSSRKIEPLTQKAATVPHAANGLIVENVGASALVVRGPVSGQTYRFPSSGTRVVVDGRDAGFLLAIPQLKKHVS